jgi:hypothetical protein
MHAWDMPIEDFLAGDLKQPPPLMVACLGHVMRSFWLGIQSAFPSQWIALGVSIKDYLTRDLLLSSQLTSVHSSKQNSGKAQLLFSHFSPQTH